ncbi:OSCP/delta subunit of ATPase [Tricharina praecox]|uniref:OSCP/delta subunit of ATPase n=1 Tax=Tricharina praecox TaxID=43433 RepID=UPI002220EBA0|nr:OSCP/delta subunit of ATPase [Tricharina praecox]KAI5842707.1 OSCP/delta subunit of ATPase [Tricharina praecox]
MFSARSVASVARTGARTFAAAAPGKSMKPPVALFGVDGTYASALYTASAKTSSLDATHKALTSLKGVLAKDPKLVRILASPTLKTDDKKLVIAEVMKAAGQDKSIKNLLEVLAENNRLGLVGGIVEKFDVLMGAHRGEIEAIITSATQLDAKTVSKLEAAISKSPLIGAGKKLKTTNKVDPSIIGGLVVEVGDRTIDLSISSKVAKLNKMLTDAL